MDLTTSEAIVLLSASLTVFLVVPAYLYCYCYCYHKKIKYDIII